MAKPVVISREETDDEKKLREWFETQTLESPRNIEEAARLLIGLVTGMLGLLFGVLTVASKDLPRYLTLAWVRWTAALAVVLWLIALGAGLAVVLPRTWSAPPGRPDSQERVFREILGWKRRWLTWSAITFGLAILVLGVVLVAGLVIL